MLDLLSILLNKKPDAVDDVKSTGKAVDKGKGKVGRFTEEQIQQILKETANGVKIHPLRQAYEKEVAGLAQKAEELLKQGRSEAEIAQIMNQARRDIGVQYNNVTPERLREYIYEVNKGRYGDPLGLPTSI
ncbi:hypothetical protein [Lysinibacillus sp. 3P01SB]|uniref:hypothetical protein n=1 Tax=Lysinibacillus sp. 3P01SB TaxID=3132284 RepID=UPI0039A41502